MRTGPASAAFAAAFAATLALGFFGAPGAQSYAEDRISDQPSGEYRLDLKHGSLIWRVFHFGLSRYTARFDKFEATIHWDDKDVSKASVTAVIDPTSVDTNYPEPDQRDFNKDLAFDGKFFNAKKFPYIRFESTSIEKTGENTGKISGNLTMLGVVKPVVLEVTFNGGRRNPFDQKPTLGFSARATLKRSDWGMQIYVPIVADEVEIQFEGEFAKQ